MKRHAWKLVILIILAAIVFLWLIKAPLVSSYLSNKMRVPVSISRISIWPSQTLIHEFKIKNPSGFRKPYAFTAETTQIDYQWKQLRGEPTVIDQIIVDGIFLDVECTNGACTSNNWTAIGANMPKQKSDREVIIHKLILTNLDAQISGLAVVKGKTLKQHVDRLEFYEIDSKQGFPTEQLIREIFGKAGMQEYIKNLLSPEKILEKINPLNPLNIFGSENDAVEVNPQL